MSKDRLNMYTFSKYQMFLTTLFIATNITYFCMAPRIITFFGFPQPGGILIFPITFLLSDIITEVYSYKYSRFLILCTVFCLGFFTLGTWVSMFVHASFDYGYTKIFNHYPRLYAAISVATLISFLTNNAILYRLKIKFNGKIFWLRSIIASSIGHALFSLIWVIAFHLGEVNISYLLKMIVCMYIWKITVEILATPIASVITSYLKAKENLEKDNVPDDSLNPFIQNFTEKDETAV